MRLLLGEGSFSLLLSPLMQSLSSPNNLEESVDCVARFSVTQEMAGVRLDQFLAMQFVEMSRSALTLAVRKGEVSINGETKKSSYKLKKGDWIIVYPMSAREQEISLAPEPLDFPILYEDDYLLFVAKPPGLVVHPGSGNHRGTLANGLLHYCRELASVGDSARPGIVHRLDKDTSGVMVVAKKERVHRQLVEMFKNHDLEKEYLALGCGIPAKENGRIVAAIGRHPVQRQKMTILEHGGRYAATSWWLQEPLGQNYSLFRLEIETGRTHQIRVHLASLGHPVAGDVVYGGNRGRRHPHLFPRQMLHAHRLKLNHPVSGKTLDIIARPWPDFQRALQTLQQEKKQ